MGQFFIYKDFFSEDSSMTFMKEKKPKNKENISKIHLGGFLNKAKHANKYSVERIFI
jgi:hypothetical protein